MDINLILTLITVVFIAIQGSLLGCFAILKRMSLVGDALSHVALPGIALAILFNINPFLGAIAFLLVAVIGIWFVEYFSTLSIDTVVGIFFTSSLALGALIIPEEELIEALFGNISSLSPVESIATIAISLFLIILLLVVHKRLALNMVSEEMSQSIGIKNRRLELIYLLIFALTVALGIRFVGALLMGALIIIPAAAAKNISRSLHGFMYLSVIFGVIASVLGIYFSSIYHSAPGPIFILISVLIFILTLGGRYFYIKV